MSKNEEVVRQACQIIWTEGQSDRVAEFYHEEFTASYPMTDWGTGLAGVKKLAESVRIGMPDYREEINLLIDGGEYITVELTIHGTHNGPLAGLAPTGKKLSFRDVTILKLRDGRIIEQRGLSDLLSLYQQLGLNTIPSAAS